MTRSAAVNIGTLVAVTLVSAVSAEEPKHAPITCLAVTSDGQTVIEASQAAIRTRETASLKVTGEWPPQSDMIHDLSLSPDEKSLIVVGGNPGEFAVVTLYSWPDMKVTWRQQFAEDVVYAASFSPDGESIALAAHDQNVYLLKATDGETESILTGHSKPVIDATFLNEELLVSCSRDQTIRVWNVAKKEIVRSLNNHTRAITDVALRSGVDGTLPLMVSGGEDRTVRFWQPTIGRMVKFKRIASPANALSFSDDAKLAVAGCRDGAVRVIDVSTLESRAIPDVVEGWIHCLVMLPDSQIAIVGGSDGSVTKVELGARR